MVSQARSRLPGGLLVRSPMMRRTEGRGDLLMSKIKVGVSGRSLGLPLRAALEEVRRLGVGGIELPTVGELAPDNLSQTGRRELRHLLKSHGLELTALNCPLRHGLDTAENLQPRIEHVQKALTLSFDLGPRI